MDKNIKELWDKVNVYRDRSNAVWEKAGEVIKDINNGNKSRWPEFMGLMDDAKKIAEEWGVVLVEINDFYKHKK